MINSFQCWDNFCGESASPGDPTPHAVIAGCSARIDVLHLPLSNGFKSRTSKHGNPFNWRIAHSANSKSHNSLVTRLVDKMDRYPNKSSFHLIWRITALRSLAYSRHDFSSSRQPGVSGTRPAASISKCIYRKNPMYSF
jgi:hypothetical protein